MRKAAILLALVVSVSAAAQFGLNVDVEVLEIETVVLDADGKPVTNLRASDFEVLLDGKKTAITNFYVASRGVIRDPADAQAEAREVPTRLVIFVDDMHLGPSEKARMINGLREFFDGHMDAKTTATILRWAESLRIVMPATSDRVALLKAVEEMTGMVARHTPEHDLKHYQSMMLLDAAGKHSRGADVVMAHVRDDRRRDASVVSGTLKGVHEALSRTAGMEGRKIFLFVSTGLPVPPTETAESVHFHRSYRDLLEVAHRYEIVFTMLNPRSRALSRTSGQQMIEEFAKDTGGKVITLASDIAGSLKTLTEQLTTYYSLGVTPPKKRQAVDVQVRVIGRPELRVLSPSRRETRSREERIDAAVRARLFMRTESNPLSANVTVSPPRRAEKLCVADVAIMMPSSRLTVVDMGGAGRGRVGIRMLLFDDAGGESSLTETYTDVYPRRGQLLRTSFPIAFESRKYVLSVAVTDDLSGETSYLLRDVDATACR